MPTSIAPWLSVGNATEAVEFYRAAFGTEESDRLDDDEGEVIVVRLSIDGAEFWVQNDPGIPAPTPSMLRPFG